MKHQEVLYFSLGGTILYLTHSSLPTTQVLHHGVLPPGAVQTIPHQGVPVKVNLVE